MATIDLGKTPGDMKDSPPTKDSKKPYYPSVYITDIQGADDLPTGEFSFSAKGKVVSKSIRENSNGKKTTSIEIEVHEITPDKSEDSGDSLDKALTKVAKKKQESAADETDEADSGMDNSEEESAEE